MNIEILGTIVVLSFICESVDSILGMGYGTTLMAILLAMGHEPLEIVPALLLSEALTGLLAGALHHEFGNVNLRIGSQDLKVASVLTILSVLGVLAAVIIAINIPVWMIKLYAGLLVLVIGVVILKKRKSNLPFSWQRIGCLGFLAAFNKGISGGGYGPVVTGGQVLSGMRGRKAVGIASLAEGVTSIAGVLTYLLTGGASSWRLAPSLILGAALSVPLAAYVVSRLPSGHLTFIIGGMSTALGGYTLLRLVLTSV